MKRKNTTRSALFTSIIALLLCISMLVGTTFAWFTDSVTSANNIIKSGNLDVEMYYADGKNAVPADGSDEWKDASEGAIFKNELWEPGYTEVRHIKIANVGSLALKYQLLVQATGIVSELAEVIDVYFVDPAAQVANRTDLADSYKVGTLADVLKGMPTNATGMLKAGEKDEVTIALKMQESAGNEYQDLAIGSSFAIVLYASQLTAETDTFDDQYDKDSQYPEITVDTATKEEGKAATVGTKDTVVDIPATAPAGNYTIEVSNKTETTDADGKTTVAMDINLMLDGIKVAADGTTVYTVKVRLEKNLDVTAVTHKGVAVENFHYDPITGIVAFTTDSFSPFTVVYEEADADTVYVPANPEVAEKLEKEAVIAVDENGIEYTTFTAAVKSGATKLYLKEGADLGTITHLDVANDLVIYGNGAYISGGEHDLAVDTYVKLSKDITVTIYNLHGVAVWGQRNTEHTVTLNLYNCNNINRVYISGTSGVNNINLYNCTADAAAGSNNCSVYSNANGSILIDGCTFKGIDCPVNFNHKIAGEQKVTVTNSIFEDCSTKGDAAYFAPIRLYNSTERANQTLTVSGNTFTYSEGKAPINGADVLLNKKHDGVDAAGTIKATVQIDAQIVSGANVDYHYTVSNAAELTAFAAEVNKGAEYEGNTFEGKTVLLTADIDLGGVEWTPIGNFGNTSKQFKGVFDGQNHTVSNFKITLKSPDREGKNRSPEGFFGNVNGTIKNFTIANATVNVTNDGRFVGGIIGRMNGGLVENCKLVNSSVEGSAWQIGGIVGQVNAGTIQNCVVENTTVAGKAGVGAVAGFQMEAKETEIKNCAVKNCTIAQNGSYGEGYDDMFAAVLGCVNNSGAKVSISGCTVENTTVKGTASNAVVGYIEAGATVTVDGVKIVIVSTTEQLIEAIKNAPVGEQTTIFLADGTYRGDIAITLEAMGNQGGDVVIKAAEGANPVITGTVTLGYRNQGTAATMYNANVTFDGITFDHAETGKHSIDVQDVKSLTMVNCTIIGDGEYGIGSARGNGTGTSKIVNCTFKNAGMQLLGNFATGLVIEGCTFDESRINVQAGNGVTVQECEFNGTLTQANVGDSFYMIRSNSTPITVKNCEINVDSELTEVASAQAKWYLLANRGTTNWTVENVVVTLTDAALAQTELKVTACTDSGVINSTNLTVNGVVK